MIVRGGYHETTTPFSIIVYSASFYSANRNSRPEIKVEPTDVPFWEKFGGMPPHFNLMHRL